MEDHRWARLASLTVALVLSLAPNAAFAQKGADKRAQGAKESGAQTYDFDLEDADLPSLVKAIGQITGKRFLYGGKLRAITATVRAGGKLTAEEAHQAFLTILQSNGLTVIPHGRMYKIVEAEGAARLPTQVVGAGGSVPREDRMITRVIRPVHAAAADVAAVFERLKSKDGDVTVHAAGNVLFVTDTGENVNRLLQVLDTIDAPGAEQKLWVQPIHHVTASQLGPKVQDILTTQGKKVRVVADDRSGVVVIAAGEEDYRTALALIERLDAAPLAEGEISVLPLQHATCKDLSQTLSQLVTAAPAGAPTAASPAAGKPALGDGAFEGKVRMTCDDTVNSLVITANPRDRAKLRTLVDRLDRPRRQVFLELTILDIGVDASRDVGVAYTGGAAVDTVGSGKSLLYAGNDLKTALIGAPEDLQGLVLGVRAPEIPGLQNILGTGISIPRFGAALQAVERSGDTNILATPHILATDNVKAEISIGQNVPLQVNVNASPLAALAGGGLAGAAAGAAGGGGQRQEVGTKVSVTPHINDSDLVRMEVVEEISEAGTAIGDLGAVPIDKRTASTTLVARDAQTVVIGGQVKTTDKVGDTAIPVLGDIPLLGHLFKKSSRIRLRSHLLLVITPHIIRDERDLRVVFERKMQERQELIDRAMVFTDGGSWKPPQDFRRANGLVEDIRQAIQAEDRKRENLAAAAPPPPREHLPGKPIKGGDQKAVEATK